MIIVKTPSVKASHVIVQVTLDDGKRDEKREVAGTLPVIVFILTKMASLPAKPAMKVQH